jgi:hypothetical protein
MAREHVLLSYGMTPRLLSRELAAEYCGVTPPTFDEHVVPSVPPVELGRRRLWDVRALDRWLDEQSGLTEAPLPPIGDLIAKLGTREKARNRR